MKSFLHREGVAQGQVEACELCSAQPRNVGTMCIACDRLVCEGPQLRELNAAGTVFKNRKLSLFLAIKLYRSNKSVNSSRTIS